MPSVCTPLGIHPVRRLPMVSAWTAIARTMLSSSAESNVHSVVGLIDSSPRSVSLVRGAHSSRPAQAS